MSPDTLSGHKRLFAWWSWVSVCLISFQQCLRSTDSGDAAWAQKSEHSEEERELRQHAHNCLEQSKKNFEKAGGYQYDDEDSVDPEEEEVVTTVPESPLAGEPAAGESKSGKKVLRIKPDGSGHQTVEIYYPETDTTELWDGEVEKWDPQQKKYVKLGESLE